MNKVDEWQILSAFPDVRFEIESIARACESISNKFDLSKIPDDLAILFRNVTKELDGLKKSDLASTIPGKIEHLCVAILDFASKAMLHVAFAAPIMQELENLQKYSQRAFDSINESPRTIGIRQTEMGPTLRHISGLLNQFEIRAQKIDETISRVELNLSEQINQSKEAVDNSIKEGKRTIDEEISAMKIELSESLERARASEKEFNGIKSRVAEGALTKEYVGNAIREKKIADNLRGISLALMTCPMIFTGVLVATSSDFSPQSMLSKLSLLLVWLIPATYAARESAKHRAQENLHKQTALDLKASAPYLATLPKELQDKFRLEIASKTFIPRSGASKEKDLYPVNAQELLEKIIDKFDNRTK